MGNIAFTFFMICLCWLSAAFIKPQNFLDSLKSIVPSDMNILLLDLGRTNNGYTIMAYGLTRINTQGANPEQTAQNLKKYPSSLLTSFMHPRDDYSIDLLFVTLQALLKKVDTDYQIHSLFMNGFVWMIPYVNIDSYEFFVREQKLSLNDRIRYAKNHNLAPDAYGNLNDQCIEPWSKGVNIDNNFWIKYSSEKNICEQFYGGSDIFSEAETKAVRHIFKTLMITIVIDLQSFGDFWVFPDQIGQQLKTGKNTHPLSPVYSDIIQKLKYGGFKVGESSGLRNQTCQGGGFIQWSNAQGILSFSYLIGKSMILTQEELQENLEKAYPIIEMVLKKNNPLYELFMSQDHRSFFILSVGIPKFSLTCRIYNEKESFENKYELKAGEIVQVQSQIPVQNAKVSLNIEQLDIEQVYDPKELLIYEDYQKMMKKQTNQKEKVAQVIVEKESKSIWQLIMILSAFLVVFGLSKCQFSNKISQQKEKGMEWKKEEQKMSLIK